MKVSPEDKALIRDFCKNRREDISGLVRRVVLTELARYSYLSRAEKKALGIAADE